MECLKIMVLSVHSSLSPKGEGGEEYVSPHCRGLDPVACASITEY